MPDLAIDNIATLPNGTPNPNYGTMYDVWARYYPTGQYPGQPTATGGSQILLSVSHDDGQTWQLQLKPAVGTNPPATVIDTEPDTGVGLPEGTGFSFWSHITIGPEGDIYVAQSSAGRFSVHHSTDGGATFSDPDPATKAGFPFGDAIFVFPAPTLAHNHFRTIGLRNIAVDPLRPGTLYVADNLEVDDPAGNALDESDVIFARSTDYGATWQTTFQVGTHRNANVVNDDNDGYRATGHPDDVTLGQTMPRMVTDEQGNIALIWYDTRRDPADHNLDVFGTISTDGGRTFSPNFRITDQSFDADAGKFIDAQGRTSFFLGDGIGLAVANHTVFAAWTDTRNGNQDIFFSRFPLSAPPTAANDRFEPNDTAATATNLGRVVVRDLPKLAIATGDQDWFRVQAAATGTLTVTATLAVPGDSVRLQLRDAGGTTLLATGTAVRNASGQIIGQRLTFSGQSGQVYLVRVLPGPAATFDPDRYTLDVSSLTADLGTHVFGAQNGSLTAGDEAFYALTAAAPGSLEVTLTPGAAAQGNFHLKLLDPRTLAVLASGQSTGTTLSASLAVAGGQGVFIHVFGDAGAHGDFSLTFINLDQNTTQNNRTLFFPTGEGPSEAVLADLTGNGRQDIVVSHVGRDVVSVLLNNGDGTFQAPRDFAVGAFVQGSPSTLTGIPNFHRDLVVADFNRDGVPDIAVVNPDSGDLSILLGHGDGTFAPQIRVDATAAPFALALGDLNNDGIPDLAVSDSTAGPTQAEVLLGRGDGTFRAPIPFALPRGDPFRTNTLIIADINHDGNNDLLWRDFNDGTVILLGNGDGTFGPFTPVQTGNGPGLTVGDLNGDGKLDVVNTTGSTDSFAFSLGNGDGTFQKEFDSDALTAGRNPVAVAVADFGSVLPNGSLGPPDGHPDLLIADSGIDAAAYTGPPEIRMLPGKVDALGHFAGFGNAIRIASPRSPLDIKVADVNGDGVLDAVVVDRDGILVVFGKQPVIPLNDTLATARNLGTVVHIVEPTQTIVPGHTDAFYTLRVPTEEARGAGDEVLDFSGFFQATTGAGINMEVRDAAGNLLGSGERFRLQAAQGHLLTLHVFGVRGAHGQRGFGAFTMDIDVLPQVVSVESQALLPGLGQNPGGPTASLVITFQGDRLDPTTAEDPANYRVTWLGPDGQAGTADDRVIVPSAGTSNRSVVYDPSTNVEVASGNVYPTAIRQTVTLLFTDPLPAGSYRIEVSPRVQAAPFNEDEQNLLVGGTGLTGHAVVSRTGGQITEGDRRTALDLVFAGGALGDFNIFETGTPFLTQLHDDLGAVLDAELNHRGDDPSISTTISDQIVDRFNPALGPAVQRPVAMLVIWLDPVSPTLVDSQGSRIVFNQEDNLFLNTIRRAYVNVTGNVEVFVLTLPVATNEKFRLTVDNVTAAARGGAIYFGADGNEVRQLTPVLRSGVTNIEISVGVNPPPPLAVPTPPPVPPVPVPPILPPPDANPSPLPEVAFALAGTRRDSAPVTAFGPVFRVDPLLSPSGSTTALASAGNASSQTGNSGGADAPPPETSKTPLRDLWTLLSDAEPEFVEMTRRMGEWLRTLPSRLRIEDGVTPGRPRTDARPPEEEDELEQSSQQETETTSADCAPEVEV
jgi:hypothetical protein